MIFRRKIYEKMKEWKKAFHGESALLIEGARRVGKSTIAEEFARNEYENYLILDFALENSDVKQNFEENIGNLDAFFRNLFLLKGKSLPEGKGLIIFDEVQLFPLARQAIKYLVQDGRYDYIETGSLISIRKNVKDILIPSEEYRLRMYPLDFEEFLWAQGDTITGQAVREAFEKRRPMGESIHRKIMKSLRTYMAVGGMPLKYSTIEKGARYSQYMDSVNFIAESMMGNACLNVSEPQVSLALFADRSNFKLFLGDTGLLVTQIMGSRAETNENIYKSIIFDKLGNNQGMVIENLVAQMLRCRGYELYFHEFKYQPAGQSKEKKYEIDFLLVRGKRLCPIEVKSSGYARHASIDYFLKKYPVKVNEQFIIYTKDLKREGNMTYLPLYMTMCL